jgi:hypothetical protein
VFFGICGTVFAFNNKVIAVYSFERKVAKSIFLFGRHRLKKRMQSFLDFQKEYSSVLLLSAFSP